MDMMLWNTLLSIAIGLAAWIGTNMYKETQRLSILLNRTREEVAKEYVTKAEVHHDINRVIDRVEQLDHKIDRLIESMKK